MQAIRYIVNQMDRYLLAQREYRTGCMVRIKHFIAKMCCIVGGKLYGNYLISGYMAVIRRCVPHVGRDAGRHMAVKLMYLANAVGQLFLLDAFLKIDYHLYGVHVVEQLIRGPLSGELEVSVAVSTTGSGLIRGQDWLHSERFPRVTLCEFEVRHQSRVHQYVVQCALTINLFNEKLFIFVWFWYVFLALITTVNSLRWLFRSLYWPGHVQYLRKQLRAFDATQREAGILGKFAENYLRRDGMFIVRLIGMNMGEVAGRPRLSGRSTDWTTTADAWARWPPARSSADCGTTTASSGAPSPRSPAGRVSERAGLVSAVSALKSSDISDRIADWPAD